MLTLIQEKLNSETTLTFDHFEFVKSEYVALYGDTLSYIVEAPCVELKLHDGGCYKEKYPILYDTVHGPLTEESLKKYGVPVCISLMERSKEDVKTYANLFRIARKYKPEVAEG